MSGSSEAAKKTLAIDFIIIILGPAAQVITVPQGTKYLNCKYRSLFLHTSTTVYIMQWATLSGVDDIWCGASNAAAAAAAAAEVASLRCEFLRRSSASESYGSRLQAGLVSS